MNTPIHVHEMDPAEKRRRMAARRKNEKLLLSLGFRRVANSVTTSRPWTTVSVSPNWYHEEIGQSEACCWPLLDALGANATAADVIQAIFEYGVAHGRDQIRESMRRAMGL